MDEKQLLNEILNTILQEEYEGDFEQMIFENYFEEWIDVNELSRIRTDNYGDAGNDYMFFNFNRKHISSLEDLEDLDIDNKGNRVDMYCVQIKNTDRLDSNVPNKFIEFSKNMLSGVMPKHYNEEVNSNILLFNELAKKFVLKAKFYIHFYYFSRVGKKQIENATDLKGRFDTLKKVFEEVDFVEKIHTKIEGINEIVKVLRTDKKFEYTFDEIEKFEAEVDKESSKTNALIALIPIKQLYEFISSADGETINDKLFESNIRDYKGRSNVNKNILESLGNKKNIDFWWLNNGITITVEDIEESKTAKKIVIVNPQIVNGLQTSYSIYNFFSTQPEKLTEEKRKVFVKILKIHPEEEEKELEIIVATNSQNEIRDKDIHANDHVQKNIEEYLKTCGKYYQRKDKYYTNRKYGKKDIVKLSEMAKYINTIYLKDPSYTRNNPGKLLSGNKYKTVFQIDNVEQDYSRYSIAYNIYNQVMSLNKGIIAIGNDEFDRANFLHHIVYVVVCNQFNNIDYKPNELKDLLISNITENAVDDALDCIIETLEQNNVPHSKVLKTIKEQAFMQQLNRYLNHKYRRQV